jgi:pimeloyl-ACP methyl ester carboxylesterase
VSAESKYVQARGIQFHHRDWGGDGPTLILFHGDQRASGSWSAAARRLRDKFHVLALDARGHGDSEWAPRGYRMADRIEDVIAWLETMQLGPVRVAAHSTGAAVMAFAALKRPELFTDLMLVEMLAQIDERFLSNIAKRETETRRIWPSKKEYEEYLAWSRATRVWHPEVIHDVAQDETKDRPDGQVESKWAPQTYSIAEREGDMYQLYPQLPGLTRRTCLVLRAERTPEEIERAKAAMAGMQDGKLVLFEGVGHNVYMEQPDMTARLIADFMAGTPLPDRVQAPPRPAFAEG